MDLPQPLGPRRTWRWPCGTRRVAPSRALLLPKESLASRASMARPGEGERERSVEVEEEEVDDEEGAELAEIFFFIIIVDDGR